MGKTIAEKIISEHIGRDVTTGEIVVSNVELCLAHDGSGPLAIRQIGKLGKEGVSNPSKTVFFLDHSAPAARKELANDHEFVRKFCADSGCVLVDEGEGICHVVTNERYVNPGDIIIGGDSHTCTGGALCAFATGMGSTDIGMGMAMGKTWFRVPETYKIYVTGQFPIGVYAKDLILHIIGLIGSDGATYKALEFCGPTIERMSIESRFTLSNMAVEAGAKVGLIASDETTRQFLAKMGRADKWRPIKADKDASYERVFEINVEKLVPTISFPHTVDNTRTIDEAQGVTIDQVVLGTCTNSRLEDWEIVARIIRGKKKAPGVRFIAVPGSPLIQKQVLDAGYYRVLAEFGAMFLPPGCGPCVGIHGGIPADGERVLSTANRNFKGRMGNPEAEIYLGSPAAVAAAAIEGVIADPRKYEKELISNTFHAAVRSEALKQVTISTVSSIEQVASETAERLGPKIKDTSEVIEKKTREVIKRYEPEARKAARELDKTIKTLATDASKAIRDIFSSRKSSPKKQTQPESEQKQDTTSESQIASVKTATKKVSRKKTAKPAVKRRALKKVAKKTAKKRVTAKTSVKKKAATKKISRKSAAKKKAVRRKNRGE